MRNPITRVKKIAALIMCLLLVAAAAGCNGDGTTPPVEGGTPAQEAPAGGTVTLSGVEFSTDPVTLTAYIDWPHSGEGYGWGQDMVSQWITETVGVTIDATHATTATGEELNLMLASGEKLPDLIVTNGFGTIVNNLIRQGYVLPLDEVAKEYFPAFLDLLPGGLYEVFQEDDGHLYRTADWFADSERILELVNSREDKAISGGDQTLCLNKKYYEQMGSPEINTLDDLRQYLLDCREKFPEVTSPFMPMRLMWDQATDTINFIYRCYGGQSWLWDDGSNTLQLCLRDPRYKEAMRFLNTLYQDGSLTDTTLGMSTEDQWTALETANLFAYVGQDWEWFSKIVGGSELSGPVLPVLAPMAEGVSRDDLKLRYNDIANLGGNTAVFISKDSENVARAIEYLAFEYSDEAALNNRFGLEGVAFEYVEDGGVRWMQSLLDYQNEFGWSEMSKKYGPNNQTHSWFTTGYSMAMESPTGIYPVKLYNANLVAPYLKNERLFDLSKTIKDDDVRMKYDQFMQLTGEAQIAIITADDDAEFEAEFANFVSQAEALDIKSLEDYYTANYIKWQGRGFTAE
ncbi:MAG: hypothetical protein LBS19_04260 [Clostridiales bacterium]|nr:hypothetical protein [Clostridiales bacterium]